MQMSLAHSEPGPLGKAAVRPERMVSGLAILALVFLGAAAGAAIVLLFVPEKPVAVPETAPSVTVSEIYFRTCADALAAGKAVIFREQPGYGRHLDPDGDGTACGISRRRR
jgi:hypothetical protein